MTSAEASSPAGARRLAAGFVLVVMAAGCLALWIAVPAGGSWLASKLTSAPGTHLLLTLAFVPSGMLCAGAALAWLNGLYLRITGGEYHHTGRVSIHRRGPLEALLLACLIAAAAAMALWFFAFAENPTVNVY